MEPKPGKEKKLSVICFPREASLVQKKEESSLSQGNTWMTQLTKIREFFVAVFNALLC